MNGIIIIDKPAGITSHDVVSRIRRTLKTKRVGHTGTLDPFATGVMVILVGQATRLAQFLDKDVKEYEAVVRCGFDTDTGDRTGIQNSKFKIRNEVVASVLMNVDWDRVFGEFRGEIDQVPPMYSAKKIQGKKLYEHARKGETVDRTAVPVTIYELELLSLLPSSAGRSTLPETDIEIRVACSAGTYIRTLAEDIGRRLGVGAHLAGLRRTAAGKFRIDQSITLERLAELNDPTSAMISMTEAVGHLGKFVVPEDRIDKTRNGMSTRIYEPLFADGETVRMEDAGGNLIAIGIFDQTENSVRPKVVLV